MPGEGVDECISGGSGLGETRWIHGDICCLTSPTGESLLHGVSPFWDGLLLGFPCLHGEQTREVGPNSDLPADAPERGREVCHSFL
jgi:hypothetical protein